MPQDFKLPDLGEGLSEAEIVRVLVAEGDLVSEDQAVLLVETEKAQVELPSPFGGHVAKVHVKPGQRVKVGSVLLSFGDGQGAAGRASAEALGTGPSAAAPVRAAGAGAPARSGAPARLAAPAAPAAGPVAGTGLPPAATPATRRL